MLSCFFIVCFWFYYSFGTIGGSEKYEGFWAGFYGTSILMLLLTKPSVFIFFQVTFVIGSQYPHYNILSDAWDRQIREHIAVPFLYSVLVSILVGLVFYATAKLSRRYPGTAAQGILIVSGIAVVNILCYFLLM